MIPQKLKKGDTVAIVAPAWSLGMISRENRQIANKWFEELGINIVFGRHVEEMDDFDSSSIQSRVDDLHDAFGNPEVKAILSASGGFNSNQLLKYIDWDLIKKNPKIFCGFSDITALNNAIYAKTGLVNYSGMFYEDFGGNPGVDYSLDFFRKCVFFEKPYEILPSKKWNDDEWYKKNQGGINFMDNLGYLVVNEGSTEGTLLGGNLSTLNLLQGTEYFPDIRGSILFIEDDYESKAVNFDRDLQSLIHQPGFSEVKGIAIGRFQKASEMTDDKLIKIIKTKKELDNIPVIANLDFGHTQPMITFPIGGKVKLLAEKDKVKIEILKH
jgi:muramoyltetrapeptide carboxypeptidase